MTREQYIEYKKSLIGSACTYVEQPLEEMLAEAEDAKKKGLLLPKEEVFAMLMSDD